MKKITKAISLIFFGVLSVLSLPAFAADVEARMLEYAVVEPNTPAVASAVITNRYTRSLAYSLDAISLQGDVLEVLTTGVLLAGETKIISGTSASRFNRSVVRVKVGDPDRAVSAQDVIYLTVHAIRKPPVN